MGRCICTSQTRGSHFWWRPGVGVDTRRMPQTTVPTAVPASEFIGHPNVLRAAFATDTDHTLFVLTPSLLEEIRRLRSILDTLQG
jgi:hypothetical protein